MTTPQLLGLGLQASIMLTVLGFGLGATLADATYLFRRPALLLRCVLSMSVVMPIVAAAVASMLDQPFEVKVALLAISIAPVPPILNQNQLHAGGRLEFVTGLLVAMSALAIVTVPLWVWILDQVFDRHGVVGPLAVAKIMLTSVFLPLAAGLLIRHFFPATQRASSKVVAIAGALLGIVAVILVWGMWPLVRTFIGNGGVLVMAGLIVIALAVGHVLGGPVEGDRTSLALATALRHPAVALAVATSGTATETKPELAVILLYLIVAFLVSLPYKQWRKRYEGQAT